MPFVQNCDRLLHLIFREQSFAFVWLYTSLASYPKSFLFLRIISLLSGFELDFQGADP